MGKDNAEIARIETDVIDKFIEHLAIRHYPKNLAQWAILTFVAADVQKASLPQYGGIQHRQKIVAASRIAALLLNELERKVKQSCVSIRSFVWNRELAEVCSETLREGQGYFVASSCFPYWHRGLLEGELLSACHLRFTTIEVPQQRRMTAYQKGIRPHSCKIQPANLAPISPKDEQRFNLLVNQATKKGANSLNYSDPTELYTSLYPWFLAQVNAMIRRSDETSFGQYNMRELKSFCAALHVICAIHDHLLFLKGLAGDLLIETYVLKRRRRDFVQQISEISKVAPNAVEAIVADLVFAASAKPIDLHYQVFVGLDSSATVLGVVPQFVLSCNFEENLMRTLSRTAQKLFDAQSDTKALQLVKEIKEVCSGSIKPFGPYELQSAKTDLDLVLVDEDNSQVLLVELKWIRKPTFAGERTRANQEFIKGSDVQLPRVRAFLKENPRYLQERGATKKPLNEYAQITYLLAGRDHLVWPELDESVLLLDFDILKERLSTEASLKSIVDCAKNYDWLPVEGVDFRVETVTAIVNGIAIECPSYIEL